MTQEEKAKAYDEALERAKSFQQKFGGDYAGYIFPELAESEDERVRNCIRCLTSLDQAQDVIADMGFTRQDLLAYLEKQKENLKSADSIPSDCVSDAKCEDRWHKVGDSLPDNPREVLCKDEAGNYFIGRYYVGEGWEISNYDDEDKPHHLNPPVSKWIDFPSEKQKEQKPTNSEKPKEWSDEQLLKEARKHFVYNILSGNDMKKMIEIYNDEVSCKPGDVVSVIVLPKEDEK